MLIIFISFYKPQKPGCTMFRLTFPLQKRKYITVLLHRKRNTGCEENKIKMNE